MKKPREVDAVVGRNIRNYRLLRGFTQTELARQIGVTFQQVQKYERGANRVGAGRLMLIAEALHLPVEALFETDAPDGPRSPGSYDELLHDPKARRLLNAFSRLANDQTRVSLVMLIEALGDTPRTRLAASSEPNARDPRH